MGVLATGRSQLTNQLVKVQRRRITRDGMGGASERFDTIVERYWVRILPDQHTERGRIEPGEQAIDGSFLALGARTLNGMSIMIGDRFLDEGNNEVYHVKGVKRPVAISSYNVGMVRYQLQIVKDANCVAAVAVSESLPSGGSLPVGSVGNGNEPGGETHLILRHFQIVDMDNIEAGSVDYGAYDGFEYAHTGVQEDVVQDLITVGKRCFRYFEVMTFPEAGFHDDWLDWWRAQGQVTWDVGLVNPSGDPAVFRYSPTSCNDRQFVDWSLIDGSMRQIIADKMFELSPNSGLYLDQAWVKESPDFFFSDPSSGGACGPCAYCATYASIPASKWLDWQASIMAFYALVDQMAADRGQWNLKNGEHRTIGTPAQQAPRPIYYENSADNGLEGGPPNAFPNSVAGWKQHARNVLSIDVPDPINLPLLLTEFDQHGGWVSFSGGAASSAAVQSAYALAAGVKATH